MSSKQNSYLSAAKLKVICANILSSSFSSRHIAKITRVSPTSVERIRKKIKELKINDPMTFNHMSPQELYNTLYPLAPRKTVRSDSESKNLPDFYEIVEKIHENKQTIKDSYKDYLYDSQLKQLTPLSLSYYSARVNEIEKKLKGSEPEYYYAQFFPYGVYAQLDFSGDKYELLTYNGRVSCWIMAICFPASYYVYAEFVTAQSTAESCRVIGNACRYIENRHPSVLVVDNARCWVNRHNGAEAVINENFAYYIQQLGMCAEACPVRHPQAKSAVESSIGLIERRLEAKRNEFSNNQRTISEHNKVLTGLVNSLINQAPFRKSSEKTREYLFKTHELPLLTVASKIPQYQGDGISMIVPQSYQIQINEHYYSVPYLYIGKRVDVYTSNDYIIVKYEGKEICRHLRTDGEGRTVVDSHKPEAHQNIDRKNRIYNSTDDVIEISKSLDDGLYRYCISKIKFDKNNNRSEKITIRSCIAVINGFKRSAYKFLYSEACLSVLNMSTNFWNIYSIQDLYKQLEDQYQHDQQYEHQTEIFRPQDDDSAYIRTTENDENQEN